MTRTITQIKVWKNRDKTETRIYVNFGKESGCLYLTGSKWNPKGKLEGMTEEEKEAAWQLVQARHGNDGYWHTIWGSELEAKPVSAPVVKTSPAPSLNRRGDHCSRCGHWVEPGLGELTHLTDEEDIDFLGGGKSWIVTHLDIAICDANIAADKAESDREAAETAAEDSARSALTAEMLRVEPFDFAGFTETLPGIFTGEVKNVRCTVQLIRYSDGETSRYFYSADPAAAGLTAKLFDDSLESSFSKLFGD